MDREVQVQVRVCNEVQSGRWSGGRLIDQHISIQLPPLSTRPTTTIDRRLYCPY